MCYPCLCPWLALVIVRAIFGVVASFAAYVARSGELASLYCWGGGTIGEVTDSRLVASCPPRVGFDYTGLIYLGQFLPQVVFDLEDHVPGVPVLLTKG